MEICGRFLSGDCCATNSVSQTASNVASRSALAASTITSNVTIATVCRLDTRKHGGRCEVVALFETRSHTVHRHSRTVEAGSYAMSVVVNWSTFGRHTRCRRKALHRAAVRIVRAIAPILAPRVVRSKSVEHLRPLARRWQPCTCPRRLPVQPVRPYPEVEASRY